METNFLDKIYGTPAKRKQAAQGLLGGASIGDGSGVISQIAEELHKQIGLGNVANIQNMPGTQNTLFQVTDKSGKQFVLSAPGTTQGQGAWVTRPADSNAGTFTSNQSFGGGLDNQGALQDAAPDYQDNWTSALGGSTYLSPYTQGMQMPETKFDKAAYSDVGFLEGIAPYLAIAAPAALGAMYPGMFESIGAGAESLVGPATGSLAPGIPGVSTVSAAPWSGAGITATELGAVGGAGALGGALGSQSAAPVVNGALSYVAPGATGNLNGANYLGLGSLGSVGGNSGVGNLASGVAGMANGSSGSNLGTILGGLAGLGGIGGAKESGTTTTTSEPWKAMQPYLLNAAQQLENNYSTSTPSSLTSLNSGIQNLANQSLSGAYDPYLNPVMDASYMDGVAQSVASNANRNLAENILPQIRSGAMANGYGSSRQGIAEGVAMRDTQNNIDNTMAPLYAQAQENYANRLMQGSNQNIAASQAAMQNRMAPFSSAFSSGDTLNNYGFNQSAKYANTMQGLGGMGGQQSTPYYTNPFGNALGMAQLGTSIYSGLFGGK